MAAQISDLNVIQDEDTLRRMWQETEDFSQKKKIRMRMYKLREDRLKSYYTENKETITDGVVADCKSNRSSRIDSLNDHDYLTMKSKINCDSASPTLGLKQISSSHSTQSVNDHTNSQIVTKTSSSKYDSSKTSTKYESTIPSKYETTISTKHENTKLCHNNNQQAGNTGSSTSQYHLTSSSSHAGTSSNQGQNVDHFSNVHHIQNGNTTNVSKVEKCSYVPTTLPISYSNNEQLGKQFSETHSCDSKTKTNKDLVSTEIKVVNESRVSQNLNSKTSEKHTSSEETKIVDNDQNNVDCSTMNKNHKSDSYLSTAAIGGSPIPSSLLSCGNKSSNIVDDVQSESHYTKSKTIDEKRTQQQSCSKISIDVSATHNAFASSLRASPDRSTSSKSSLDRVSLEKSPRVSPEKCTSTNDLSRKYTASFQNRVAHTRNSKSLSPSKQKDHSIFDYDSDDSSATYSKKSFSTNSMNKDNNKKFHQKYYNLHESSIKQDVQSQRSPYSNLEYNVCKPVGSYSTIQKNTTEENEIKGNREQITRKSQTANLHEDHKAEKLRNPPNVGSYPSSTNCDQRTIIEINNRHTQLSDNEYQTFKNKVTNGARPSNRSRVQQSTFSSSQRSNIKPAVTISPERQSPQKEVLTTCNVDMKSPNKETSSPDRNNTTKLTSSPERSHQISISKPFKARSPEKMSPSSASSKSANKNPSLEKSPHSKSSSKTKESRFINVTEPNDFEEIDTIKLASSHPTNLHQNQSLKSTLPEKKRSASCKEFTSKRPKAVTKPQDGSSSESSSTESSSSSEEDEPEDITIEEIIGDDEKLEISHLDRQISTELELKKINKKPVHDTDLIKEEVIVKQGSQDNDFITQEKIVHEGENDGSIPPIEVVLGNSEIKAINNDFLKREQQFVNKQMEFDRQDERLQKKSSIITPEKNTIKELIPKKKPTKELNISNNKVQQTVLEKSKSRKESLKSNSVRELKTPIIIIINSEPTCRNITDNIIKSKPKSGIKQSINKTVKSQKDVISSTDSLKNNKLTIDCSLKEKNKKFSNKKQNLQSKTRSETDIKHITTPTDQQQATNKIQSSTEVKKSNKENKVTNIVKIDSSKSLTQKQTPILSGRRKLLLQNNLKPSLKKENSEKTTSKVQVKTISADKIQTRTTSVDKIQARNTSDKTVGTKPVKRTLTPKPTYNSIHVTHSNNKISQKKAKKIPTITNTAPESLSSSSSSSLIDLLKAEIAETKTISYEKLNGHNEAPNLETNEFDLNMVVHLVSSSHETTPNKQTKEPFCTVADEDGIPRYADRVIEPDDVEIINRETLNKLRFEKITDLNEEISGEGVSVSVADRRNKFLQNTKEASTKQSVVEDETLQNRDQTVFKTKEIFETIAKRQKPMTVSRPPLIVNRHSMFSQRPLRETIDEESEGSHDGEHKTISKKLSNTDYEEYVKDKVTEKKVQPNSYDSFQEENQICSQVDIKIDEKVSKDKQDTTVKLDHIKTPASSPQKPARGSPSPTKNKSSKIEVEVEESITKSTQDSCRMLTNHIAEDEVTKKENRVTSPLKVTVCKLNGIASTPTSQHPVSLVKSPLPTQSSSKGNEKFSKEPTSRDSSPTKLECEKSHTPSPTKPRESSLTKLECEQPKSRTPSPTKPCESSPTKSIYEQPKSCTLSPTKPRDLSPTKLECKQPKSRTPSPTKPRGSSPTKSHTPSPTKSMYEQPKSHTPSPTKLRESSPTKSMYEQPRSRTPSPIKQAGFTPQVSSLTKTKSRSPSPKKSSRVTSPLKSESKSTNDKTVERYENQKTKSKTLYKPKPIEVTTVEIKPSKHVFEHTAVANVNSYKSTGKRTSKPVECTISVSVNTLKQSSPDRSKPRASKSSSPSKSSSSKEKSVERKKCPSPTKTTTGKPQTLPQSSEKDLKKGKFEKRISTTGGNYENCKQNIESKSQQDWLKASKKGMETLKETKGQQFTECRQKTSTLQEMNKVETRKSPYKTVKKNLFGVTPKRSSTGSSTPTTTTTTKETTTKVTEEEEEKIEEIFDLEVLEKMLEQAVKYDIRSRIRAQIRLIKRQQELKSTSSRTPSPEKPLSKNKKSLSNQASRVTTVKTSISSKVNDTPDHRDKVKKRLFGNESSSTSSDNVKESKSCRKSSATYSKTSSTTSQSGVKLSASRNNCSETTTSETSVHQASNFTSLLGSDTKSTTESIISGYGVGPTDQNGRPLFGLRALRTSNDSKFVDEGDMGMATVAGGKQKSDYSRDVVDSSGRPLFGLKALQRSSHDHYEQDFNSNFNSNSSSNFRTHSEKYSNNSSNSDKYNNYRTSTSESSSTVYASRTAMKSDGSGNLSILRDEMKGELHSKDGKQPTGKMIETRYSYQKPEDGEAKVKTKSTTHLLNTATADIKTEDLHQRSDATKQGRCSENSLISENDNRKSKFNSSSLIRKISNEHFEKAQRKFSGSDEATSSRHASKNDSSDSKEESSSSKKTSYSHQKGSVDETSRTTSSTYLNESSSTSKSVSRGDSFKEKGTLQQPTVSSSMKQVSKSSSERKNSVGKDKSERANTEDHHSTSTSNFFNSDSNISNGCSMTTSSYSNQFSENNTGSRSEFTDDEKDAISRLNKFVSGGSISLHEMQRASLSSCSEHSLSSTKSASLVRQFERQQSQTKEDKEVDIEQIWNEDQLRNLLEACTDYENRRLIRARLRSIMAENKANTDIVPAADSAEQTTSTPEKQQQQTTNETSEITNNKDNDMSSCTKVQSRTTTTTGRIFKANSVTSPFSKFRQLDRQNSLPSSGAPPKNADSNLTRSASTIRDRMLTWVKAQTKEYESVQIDNFSTSWNNGLAFCALIHHFCPHAFDFNKLTPEQRRYNFELAFRVAEDEADIVPLLDVEDMVMMKRPDWKCVFTYVQSVYQRFHATPKAVRPTY